MNGDDHTDRINKTTPPLFKQGIDYERWKQEIAFWQEYTSLKKGEQGFAIYFRMSLWSLELYS